MGISGFGGGEAMRLIASHPSFQLVYAVGEGSADSRLADRFPVVRASRRVSRRCGITACRPDASSLPARFPTLRQPGATAPKLC
ncbi:hypothetical protein [Burkholderia sp. 8Y]|uniref:hypothetical protein n=1 Tax=Burkholderia sp. 8Y TaxID=2653133 RepID=UPI0022A76FA6|nr:hypothetical protein [Burkholderia sp. 8Y]